MTEEIIYSLVEIYNDLALAGLHLTMTKNVATSLAHICDESASGVSIQRALSKILERVIRTNAANTLIAFPLRFFSNEKFFYYFVLAKRMESRIHIEILVNDDSLRKRFSDID